MMNTFLPEQAAAKKEQADARRKIAHSLVRGRSRAPRYAGEGFSDGVQKIIGALMLRDMNQSKAHPFERMQGAPIGADAVQRLTAGGIPGYRRGTNYAPGGLAVVGEEGPELVELPEGSKVKPTPELLQFLEQHPDAPHDRKQYLLDNPQLPPSMWPHMISPPEGNGSQFVPGDPQGDAPPDAYDGRERERYDRQGPMPPRGQPDPGFDFDGRELLIEAQKGVPQMQPQTAFAPGAEYQTADMSGIGPSGVGEQNQLHAAARAYQGLMKSLQDYEKMFNEGGATMWPGERKDELDVAHRDLQMQMKELYNLGVLNGPDLELMNQILLSPTTVRGNIMDVFGGNMDMEKRIPANIDQVRRLMRNRTTPALQQLGIDPGDLEPKQRDPSKLSDAELLKMLSGGN